jgi:hypothetical protein
VLAFIALVPDALELVEVILVRNCVLHSSGNVEKLKNKGDKQELRNGINKNSGFSITNDFIILEEEFCKAGQEAVQNLCANLFTILT